MGLLNSLRVFRVMARSCGTLAKSPQKKSYDNYLIGAGLGSIAYMITYSIYEAKTIHICQYPPLPAYPLSRDSEAISVLKNNYFDDVSSFLPTRPEVKVPVAVVGNLGSGKSVLVYQLCSELYKPARFYDLRLPSSKICVFLDMTNSETFLESLRMFVGELYEKTRNKSVEHFDHDLLALKPYEQASKLLVHMYTVLNDHPDWCIVLDNITPKSFNDMKHIFANYFSVDPSLEYSVSKMKGKIVYVCDADIPMIENVNFYQYNQLAKETAKAVVIDQLGIPNMNEKDVSCLVDLLCGSPIALIAACYLVKDQLNRKRHVTLNEAAKTVATSISLLADKLAKKQAIDININNFSYVITMTTLAMMYKHYQLNATVPYQLSVPFEVKPQYEQLGRRALLALNATYGRVCEFFAAFQVGTKIPDTLLAKFVNKYISSFDDEAIAELTQTTLLVNPTAASKQSMFQKYYSEYLKIKSEISDSLFGSNKKCFTQSDEKLNKLIEWIPFLRFQQHQQQRLVSLHPLVHESSKMMLKILTENDPSSEVSENDPLNKNAAKVTEKSFFGAVLSSLAPNPRTLDETPTTFSKAKLENVYRQMSFSLFNPGPLFKLKPTGKLFESCFMTYIANVVDSVTLAAPVRYGDCVYYTLKQISLIQRVLNVFFKDETHDNSSSFYYSKWQYSRCVRKIAELLLSLKQPKFVLEILTHDSMIADAVCGGTTWSPSAGEYVNELTLLSILLAQSYVMLDKFDEAKQLLDRLWLTVDPGKNTHSSPALCVHLIYVCCLLYDRMFDHYDGHSSDAKKFVDEIFSYMVLVYNYQFQNTLLQSPIYDENKATFFIDIMLLFSNLCLKYNKFGYALKFVKDADILNKNVLKSGLTSIDSPCDQSITNMMIRCYEFQDNQPMVNQIKAAALSKTTR